MPSSFVQELSVDRYELENLQFSLMYYGNGGFDWESLEMMTIGELNRAIEFVVDAKQKEAENYKKQQAEAKAKSRSSKR